MRRAFDFRGFLSDIQSDGHAMGNTWRSTLEMELHLTTQRRSDPAIANFNYTRPRIRSRVRFRLSGFALAGSSVCIAGAKGKGEGARRRATQHGEAERRRDLRSADVAPTSPVHTTFARPVTVQARGGRHRTALTVPPARDHVLSSLVIRSASSVSLRIVALPAADAASRVNGPTSSEKDRARVTGRIRNPFG